jgi:hypothetical protein
MALKLPKLPDRQPVKYAILLSPALEQELRHYAAFYEAEYGKAEKVADLIPAMLEAFVESDRDFARRRKG